MVKRNKNDEINDVVGPYKGTRTMITFVLG